MGVEVEGGGVPAGWGGSAGAVSPCGWRCGGVAVVVQEQGTGRKAGRPGGARWGQGVACDGRRSLV
jgi:hypothetical protein